MIETQERTKEIANRLGSPVISLDNLHELMSEISLEIKEAYLQLEEAQTGRDKIEINGIISQLQSMKHRCLSRIQDYTIERDQLAATMREDIEDRKALRRIENNRQLRLQSRFMEVCKQRLHPSMYKSIYDQASKL